MHHPKFYQLLIPSMEILSAVKFSLKGKILSQRQYRLLCLQKIWEAHFVLRKFLEMTCDDLVDLEYINAIPCVSLRRSM